jgi:hypothetical protein
MNLHIFRFGEMFLCVYNMSDIHYPAAELPAHSDTMVTELKQRPLQLGIGARIPGVENGTCC